MNRISVALPLAPALALMLAACGSDADEPPTDLETAESDGAAEALARNIEAVDFLDLELGAKIVGPQGPEVKAALSNPEGNFADMRSYVACPAGMTVCDPATAPEGTIYTYVHIVYPGEDNQPDSGSGEGADSSDVERATAFRMTRPSTGFTGAVGYSKDEAMAAIGAKADVVITCDDGALVWTVSAGDGGDQWEQAEPLTFWWQSTVPPAGPVEAYAIEANYTMAMGNGPYPGEAPDAVNACDRDTVSGAEG